MNTPLLLSYTRAANHWTEALPVGNGRLGAMHFGGIAHDHVQFNEDTLWSGTHRDWNNPAMREALPRVRAAVKAGDYFQADQLARDLFGPWTESYLPLGDLRIEFTGLEETAVTHYTRQLDLDGALSSVSFQHRSVTHHRQLFASFPDQVIVLQLSVDQPGALSFQVRLDSELPHVSHVEGSDRLVMTGRAPEHVEPNYVLDAIDPIRFSNDNKTIQFVTILEARIEGGTLRTTDKNLIIDGATQATLILSASTTFASFDRPLLDLNTAKHQSVEILSRVSRQSSHQLLSTHQADHRALFRRVELDLGPASTVELPTDERIQRWKQSHDPQLATLLYQFGRYLLIASSRPGSQPANLQGIWNDQLRAPWSSNYTLNINAPMNYWPAESANLPECHEPLFRLIRELAVTGRETARINYGARGWMAHHNTDLWRHTAPVSGQTKWAAWYVGGAWLSLHLWEHYAFSGDLLFLREQAWPLLRGAAEFLLDWLTEDANGHLVTSLSSSPEANFVLPDGRHAGLSQGSTMDMAIVRELFTACAESARLLQIDDDFTRDIAAALPRLLPARLGPDGCIREWAHDYPIEDVHHRHVSLLFGLHPGSQITTDDTPELFHGAAATLIQRGDASTGWSLAWKLNLWARLRDGDHALRLIEWLLTPCPPGYTISESGGVFSNLFDAHPPFQIDGNFGFTSGVNEMLLQSHGGGIDPLPALPSEWSKGHVRGLRARGGYQVDIDWSNGRWNTLSVCASLSNTCRVRVGTEPLTLYINKQPIRITPDLTGWIAILLKAGDRAELHRSL